MKHAVFDTETNGLLADSTVMHSLVLRDLETNEVVSCADQPGFIPIEQGLDVLASAEKIYAHNAIKHDYPVIKKLYPRWHCDQSRVVDTLVAVRLVFAHQKDLDYNLARQGRLPGHLIGSHSLESWGYRLGLHKDQYTLGWEQWNPEMQGYCETDTDVDRRIIQRLRARRFSKTAMETEHELAWYLAEQERFGVVFNVEAAQELQAKIAGLRESVAAKLRRQFGSWYVSGGEFTPKRPNRTKGYVTGATCTKLKLIEFNPGSRGHIADRLQKLYGWVPKKFTNSGQPEVNDGSLKGMDFPGVEDLREYLLMTKRLGQLSEGPQAWLKKYVEHPDGTCRIHGNVIPNGTPTSRARHSHPNMGQVPKAEEKVRFGRECRALFGPPPGWVQIGADAMGLELRMLAHYLAKYDGGRYAKKLLESDIHEEVMKDLGLPSRSVSKTTSYALIYGAGDPKLGRIQDPAASDDRARKLGASIRAKYEAGIVGWKQLNDSVRKRARAKGWLRGLDHRRIYVRAEHAALNYLLQCAGSLVVKYWMVAFARQLREQIGEPGNLWFPMLWIHDEVQLAVRPEVSQQISEILVNCMPPIGDRFKLRCPVEAEAKVGSNWAETH